MKLRTFPIFLAFLCMGFGDAVGPFVGLAKTEFTLSNAVALLIPFTGFIMFGLLSVPMGIYQDKKGKKFILILGLVIALIGLVIPIFGLSTFPLFLLTVLLLGAGATTLQVAGNPIMRDVSVEGRYARNLSIGQFVKAIGSLAGPVLPVIAVKWLGVSWKIIFPIYSTFILLTIISVASLNIQERKDEGTHPASLASCLVLLKNRYVGTMVLAIFLSVGAGVSMSSGIPLYLEAQFGINIVKLGLLGTGLYITTVMIGRFLGGVILHWMPPKRFFKITSALSVFGILGLFTGNQIIVIIGVAITGLGSANIFPLIFSITIESLPEKTNELSGLMVMAIVGGAILPPLMGVVADNTSVLFGFIVPLLATVYILTISFVSSRKTLSIPAT